MTQPRPQIQEAAPRMDPPPYWSALMPASNKKNNIQHKHYNVLNVNVRCKPQLTFRRSKNDCSVRPCKNEHGLQCDGFMEEGVSERRDIAA
jgi:hypothetical protein